MKITEFPYIATQTRSTELSFRSKSLKKRDNFFTFAKDGIPIVCMAAIQPDDDCAASQIFGCPLSHAVSNSFPQRTARGRQSVCAAIHLLHFSTQSAMLSPSTADETAKSASLAHCARLSTRS
jgi:hypothetical protein